MADIQFIVDEIRKARPLMIGVGVVMILIAAGAAFIPVEAGAAAWVPFAKWGALASFVVIGVVVLVSALKAPEKHDVVLLLTQTPERIVWAHVMQVRNNGVHTSTLLVLHTDAGKTLQATLPRSEEGEQRGLSLVRAVAPRATVGFRPEYEAQFKKDPASLRQQ